MWMALTSSSIRFVKEGGARYAQPKLLVPLSYLIIFVLAVWGRHLVLNLTHSVRILLLLIEPAFVEGLFERRSCSIYFFLLPTRANSIKSSAVFLLVYSFSGKRCINAEHLSCYHSAQALSECIILPTHEAPILYPEWGGEQSYNDYWTSRVAILTSIARSWGENNVVFCLLRRVLLLLWRECHCRGHLTPLLSLSGG